MTAIGLLSGGLDSRLAVKMLQEQGVDVIALNFVTPFCNCTAKSSCTSEARKASQEYGIKLEVIPLFEEFMEVVRRPKYGYGSGMNPCIDCRILMFRKAAEYMREADASFIVTGEVLGERPMSQRLDAIRTIEQESGLTGLVVRPLSAHLFAPSVPEQKGWVDREKLLGISGRSRKPQIALAQEVGVYDYPCPAGGCLLTDKHFATRLRRLLSQTEYPAKKEVLLLKVGRHFQAPSGAQVVVGRNESENQRLEQLKAAGDWVLTADQWLGPTTILRGKAIDRADLETAAQLTAGYSKGCSAPFVDVSCCQVGVETAENVKVTPDRRAALAPK